MKKIIQIIGIVCLSLFLFNHVNAQQANDLCAGAISLTVGQNDACNSLLVDNTGSTDSGETAPTCASYNGGDNWYTVTIPASGTVTVETTNSGGGVTDGGMSVYSGACGALVQVECDDDDSPDGLFSLIALTGQNPGDVFYVRVWEFGNNAFGTFNICAYEPAPPPAAPANDMCANAIALTVNADLTCGAVTNGTIESATDSGTDTPAEDNTICGGTEDDDVWYSFVATSADHQIDLINITGGTTDLYHSVWSGACGTLTNIVCSDPNTSTLTGLTAGDTYLVRVYSWTATAGQTSVFDICVSTVPPPPPAPPNDDIADAIDLGTVPADGNCDGVNVTASIDFTSATAGPNALDPSCDAFGTNLDAFYTFTAGPTGEIEISVVSGDDMEILVFDASGEFGCFGNTDAGQSQIATGLTPGNVYTLQVWVDDFNANVVDFCIQEPPPPPPAPANDDIADAIDLGTVPANGSCDGVNVSASIDFTSATAGPNALDPSCDGTGTNLDAFYTFTAGSSGQIDVNVVAGDDMEFAVYDLAGVEFGCIGNTDAGQSGSISGLTPGDVYILQVWVDDFNANVVDFCIQEPPPPPVNDICSGATVLNVGAFCDGTNTIGDNTTAIEEGIYDAGCFSGTVNDVWFSFTASDPGLGFVQVSTDYLGGTNDDTEIALWGGPDCDNLTELACSQDEGDVVNFNSIFTTPIEAGEEYFVQVSGWNGTTGTFCLDVIDVCPDADIDYNVMATTCDMTGATVELQDSYGAVLASAPLGVGGGSGSFGTFPCGAYQIVITGAPQCYTQPGGDVGPRLVALEGVDVSEEFTNMPEVPTLSQWGLITLALLLSAFGAVMMSATKLAFAGTSSVPMPFTNISLPFNTAVLRKALQITGLIALVGFGICFAIFGAIFMSDIIGVAIAGPVFAYLIHLIYLMEKK